VSVVEPVKAPRLAMTEVVPALTAVPSPEPEIVATAGSLEDQLTLPVRSGSVPSEYVPLALN
jgi:hypothetical protein